MDFLVAQKEQSSNETNLKRKIEMQLFKSSVFSPEERKGGDQSASMDDKDQFTDYTGQFKEEGASLDLEKIKPADRVTFLLNYIFLVLTNN